MTLRAGIFITTSDQHILLLLVLAPDPALLLFGPRWPLFGSYRRTHLATYFGPSNNKHRPLVASHPQSSQLLLHYLVYVWYTSFHTTRAWRCTRS